MSLRALAGAAAVLWLAFAGEARAQSPDSLAAEPAIPAPVGFVNDHAAVMSESERARLEGFLDQVKRKTGVEFAVLVVPATKPLEPSEYKVKVFERWGLGAKGKDNGLLMLVALEEREVRFETGYGLEGTLPDGFQSRVFRDEMAPRFRAGDIPGGIEAGVVRCAARIAAEAGVTLEWNGRELRYSERAGRGRLPPLLVLLLVLVIVIVVLSVLGGGGRGGRRRRGMMGPWYGGWGGFGGGLGGGGFGGGWGGGWSGGGGFGGGSFGGFGGGASGGGGGGGKW